MFFEKAYTSIHTMSKVEEWGIVRNWGDLSNEGIILKWREKVDTLLRTMKQTLKQKNGVISSISEKQAINTNL